MNPANKKPALFQSKTYYRAKSQKVRADDQTVLTISLSKDLRKESRELAEKTLRSEAQLWRMAFAYAQSVGWDKIPPVP